MNRGIKFNNIHSFRNFNLILSKAEISPAIPKTNFIEIPGSDIPLDLTEALGGVNYSSRECKFTFTMNPSGGLSEGAFEAKKTEVSNALNGLACNIILDKDPDYFYKGRCTVDEYLSEKKIRQIVIKATVHPYKYKKDITAVTVAAGSHILSNGRMSVVPTIITTAETKLTFNGNSYSVNAGTHKILNIELTEGENAITVETTGTVTFTYQEGAL